MDYSTISNKTNCTEMEELTNGEVSERYYLLKKQHENLSRSHEVTKQEFYEMKRKFETAMSIQADLSNELETLQAEEARRKNEVNNRVGALQEEIAQLCSERSDILEKHSAQIRHYENEIRSLKESQAVKVSESPVRDDVELKEARAAASAALDEAAAAKAAFESVKGEMVSWQMKVEELTSEVSELRAAAELRREQVRAASAREEAAVAELAEAKAMLLQFTDPQDLQPHAVKGNSIFAEVEDKRQEMAKNLIQMKQTNSRLRRELANKQSEVDALLHEKQTIWEQQAGATAHHDRELIEQYEERITQLEGVCERQRRELARWFSKLHETGGGWLPGVLQHLKSECEQLRAEVLSSGAAQLASAAQIRELRRKLALHAVNNAKQSISPANKSDTTHDEDKAHIAPAKVVKAKPTIDDVKKKVSFN